MFFSSSSEEDSSLLLLSSSLSLASSFSSFSFLSKGGCRGRLFRGRRKKNSFSLQQQQQHDSGGGGDDNDEAGRLTPTPPPRAARQQGAASLSLSFFLSLEKKKTHFFPPPSLFSPHSHPQPPHPPFPSRDPAEEPRLKPWVEKGLVGFQPPKTPWRDFLKKIESAKVLCAPNGHDASPRVVAEALSLDVAVLVNANIDGGWKYGEHEETGATFTSAGDVVGSYDKIVKNYARGKLAPRRWFKENSGIKNSAIRLEAFLELTVGEERLARAATVGAKVTQ